MISLLAGRPFAENYLFHIDIDSAEQHDDGRTNRFADNQLYQLAQHSPSVAHALLMVSASHLATIEGVHASSDRRVIYHKDRALQFLADGIQNLPAKNFLEILATIAILASHEVGVTKTVSISERQALIESS